MILWYGPGTCWIFWIRREWGLRFLLMLSFLSKDFGSFRVQHKNGWFYGYTSQALGARAPKWTPNDSYMLVNRWRGWQGRQGPQGQEVKRALGRGLCIFSSCPYTPFFFFLFIGQRLRCILRWSMLGSDLPFSIVFRGSVVFVDFDELFSVMVHPNWLWQGMAGAPWD